MQRLDRRASGTQHLRWGRAIVSTLGGHERVAQMPKFTDYLSDKQKAAIAREKAIVAGLVEGVGAAVTPYRTFLDTAFLDVRAAQRVADYLCDDGQRSVDGLSPQKAEIEAYIAGGLKAVRGNLALSRVVRAGREATRDFARGAANLLRLLPADKFPAVETLATRLLDRAELMQQFLDEEDKDVEQRRAPLRTAVTRAVNALREGLEQMDARLRADFSAAFIESLYPQLDARGRAVDDAPDEEDGGGAPDTPDAPVSPERPTPTA